MPKMTAMELATMLRQGAHTTGRCVCGGLMTEVGLLADPDTGELERVFQIPHRLDCPVLMVFGRNAKTRLHREGTR